LLGTFPALFCVGYFPDRVSGTICPGWLWTMILQISASWVDRTTGVSHGHLTWVLLSEQLISAFPGLTFRSQTSVLLPVSETYNPLMLEPFSCHPLLTSALNQLLQIAIHSSPFRFAWRNQQSTSFGFVPCLLNMAGGTWSTTCVGGAVQSVIRRLPNSLCPTWKNPGHGGVNGVY
jgi:hypothetical protein